MTAALVKKLRAMDGAELRFRAAAAVKARVDRARTAIVGEPWRRESVRLSAAAPAPVRAAVARREWMAAHLAFAAHVASRPPVFPLDPARLDDIATTVRTKFAGTDAVARAERIVAGTYDLLGYRDVRTTNPPDWHADPVHGRSAPLVFWQSVPYLDAACGDHKITWEINRHQHFLALGRAYALTGDTKYYDTFRLHLADWIRSNPPLQGTNWASMLELAFRCLSWLWALHVFARAASPADDTPWTIDLLMALDRQLAHVEGNLSRYFSPNTHLTGEALALYVAGRALPELAASSRYAQTGRDVLSAEIARQVLADGGHAERSAHYHRYSTDFYLLAFATARVSRDECAPVFEDAARRQARFLRTIATDDGMLPLIGDDDGGQLFPICRRAPADASDTLASAALLLDEPALLVGPVPEETYWMYGSTSPVARLSPLPAQPLSGGLQASGYYVSRNSRGDHLIFDAGSHGFLNGGHAHADALAVVLTVAGRPLLVDPGTATYTMDLAARDHFRSTAMHNTVVVGGEPQSVPRGPFHWATRTDAQGSAWRPGASADYIEGWHAGYAPVLHVRSVTALHGIGWVIIDHLLGGHAAVTAAAMWHVHPRWQVAPQGDGIMRLIDHDGTFVSVAASRPLREVDGPLRQYAPEYGRVEQGSCLTVEAGGVPPFAVCTFISVENERAIRVVPLAITTPPGDGSPAAAFRIDTDARSLIVLSSVRTAGGAGRLETWGAGEFSTTAHASVLQLSDTGAAEVMAMPRSMASPVHPTEPDFSLSRS